MLFIILLPEILLLLGLVLILMVDDSDVETTTVAAAAKKPKQQEPKQKEPIVSEPTEPKPTEPKPTEPKVRCSNNDVKHEKKVLESEPKYDYYDNDDRWRKRRTKTDNQTQAIKIFNEQTKKHNGCLVGQVVDDLRTWAFGVGESMVEFTIQVDTGEHIDCVAYGEVGMTAYCYIKKGDTVNVRGNIEKSEYEDFYGKIIYEAQVRCTSIYKSK